MQQLFSRAIQQIKTSKSPLDENALDVRNIHFFHYRICKLTGSDFDSLLRFRFDEEIYQSKL